MYKQAAANILPYIKAIPRWIDNGAQAIGSTFVPGKKLARQAQLVDSMNAKSLGKTFATDAAELRRIEKLQAAEALLLQGQKRLKNAQRAFGYTAAGVPIVAGSTGLVLSGRRKDADTAEGEKAYGEYRNSLAVDRAKNKQHLARTLAEQSDERAKADEEYTRKMWNDIALVGAGGLGFGALGALIDRRDRLRGFLLGAVSGAAATGIGKYLYDINKETQA